MRLFWSDVAKLRRRLASWLSLGLLAGLLTLLFVGVGATAYRDTAQPGARSADITLRFPAAYEVILGFILGPYGLGGLLAVTYGAAIAGSEWTWGTLKSAIARGESRTRYVLATFAAIALMVAIGFVIAFLVGVGAALLGGRLAGVATGNLGDPATLQRLPERFVRGWIALLEEASIGFSVATLARNQLAGIGAGIGLFVGEAFATIFLPDIIKYLPFNVATAAGAPGSIPGAFLGTGVGPLAPDAALVVAVAWIVGAIVVASLFTERAEITG